MTPIEQHELKGITVKNLFVTITGTASIVASVIATYFGLKSEIQEVRLSQQTETQVTEVRIRVLENEVNILQKEVDDFKTSHRPQSPKSNQQTLFTAIRK